LALRGPSPLPLSNVKRLFRSRYNLELSETALGHTTLSELLNDSRFHNVCEVQLLGRYHVAVSRQPALAADSEAPKVTDKCEEKKVANDDGPLSLPGMQNLANKKPLTEQFPPPVRHTFIHFQETPCQEPSSLGAARRSSSWPQVGTRPERPAHVDDECHKGARTTKACFTDREPLSLFPAEQLELGEFVCQLTPRAQPLDKNTREVSPLMTPSPLYTAKEASDSFLLRPDAWEATCLALGMQPIEQGRAGASGDRRAGKHAQEERSCKGHTQSNFDDNDESEDDEFAPQHSARAQTPEREELWQWHWLPATASPHRLVESSHTNEESLLEQKEPEPRESACRCADRCLRPRTILATGTSTETPVVRVSTAGVKPTDIPMGRYAQLSPAPSHSAFPNDVPQACLASVVSHGSLPADIPGAWNMNRLSPAASALRNSTSFVAANNPGVTWAAMPTGSVPASAGGWAMHSPPPKQHHQPQATSQGLYATPVLRLACMI